MGLVQGNPANLYPARLKSSHGLRNAGSAVLIIMRSFSEAKVGAVSKEGFKKKAACNQCNFLEFKKSNDSDGVPNMLKTLIWLKRV